MSEPTNKPLTLFDRQLLEVAAMGKSQSNWNWYHIARLVVYSGAEGERHMMHALRELAELGLILIIQQEGHSVPDYRITDEGREVLARGNDKRVV